MSSTIRDLTGLVRDNPIVHKDGVLAFRRKKTLIVFGVATALTAIVSVLIWLDETHALRYAPDRPVGDGLLMAMFSLSFAVAGLLLPAMASSSLAGEREHGTLPLLTVTGLSPARIVVGKIVAMLVLAAPFVALPLPSFALGAIAFGLDPVLVAVALAGLATSMVAFAAVGVYVSALTTRSRNAAPGALVGAVVPFIFCAMPTIAVMVDAVDGNFKVWTLDLALGGIIAGVVIAAAAAHGAWSALSPQSTPRFARATALFGVVVVGLPVAAMALSTHARWMCEAVSAYGASQAMGSLFAGACVLAAAALLIYSAGVGADRRAPAPWIVVPTAVAVAGFTLVMTAMAATRETPTMTDNNAAESLVFILHLIAAASMAAFAGRFIKNPMAAAAGGGVLVLAIVLIPAVLDELISGPTPLRFLNVAYVNASHVVPALVFWTALSVVGLAFARRRRVAS